MAIARQLLRQRLFQAGAGDDDAVALRLIGQSRALDMILTETAVIEAT